MDMRFPSCGAWGCGDMRNLTEIQKCGWAVSIFPNAAALELEVAGAGSHGPCASLPTSPFSHIFLGV